MLLQSMLLPFRSFKKSSTARVAAKRRVPLNGKPILVLAPSRCTTHFQPDGFDVFTTSYRMR